MGKVKPGRVRHLLPLPSRCYCLGLQRSWQMKPPHDLPWSDITYVPTLPPHGLSYSATTLGTSDLETDFFNPKKKRRKNKDFFPQKFFNLCIL